MENLIEEYNKLLERIDKMETKQNELEDRLNRMEQVLNAIEKDIYLDEGFDFEIVCPYCNIDFVIDLEENKNETECPECKNIIELDWSGDLAEEGHGCEQGCSNGCCGENLEDDM